MQPSKPDVICEIRSRFAAVTVVASATAGVIEFDYYDSTTQRLTLDANVTTMTVVNWPPPGKTGRLIIEITNAGAFAINAWPTGTLWSGGNPPVITQGAGARDIIVLSTDDQGATVFGNIVGQDYR